MNKLGDTTVGRGSPVRIMGILNVSPESFYKKSIMLSKAKIKDAVLEMESDGADFVDVGGMSTAPHLSALLSEKTELERVMSAINVIQSVSNIPISVDTCRASVAKIALESGVEIINDVSGLKFDKNMRTVVSQFRPSVILCAYSARTVTGDLVEATRDLLRQSVEIARGCNVPSNRIVVDPAIGFFRRTGKGRLFTNIKIDWAYRDVQALRHLRSIRQGHPVLVSVSNKSFLGEILKKDKPEGRLFGSIAAEAVSVLCGADIIRTHNVAQTKDAVSVASAISRRVLSEFSTENQQ